MSWQKIVTIDVYGGVDTHRDTHVAAVVRHHRAGVGLEFRSRPTQPATKR